MKRQVIYRYIGTNGVIDTPIHLEDIYYIRRIKLIADNDKLLTNGERILKSVTVPEAEEKDWFEISE